MFPHFLSKADRKVLGYQEVQSNFTSTQQEPLSWVIPKFFNTNRLAEDNTWQWDLHGMDRGVPHRNQCNAPLTSGIFLKFFLFSG